MDLEPSVWRRIYEIRERIHRHPELAFHEFNTSALIQAELTAAEIPWMSVAGTGIVATIDSGHTGRTVAIRGDMDALPIHEAKGLPFRSEIDGVMHACGHDVHTAWTLAAALLLRDHITIGKVKVIFQPAEETVQGAKAILESGILSDVDIIFGAHVDRHFSIGTVVCQAGSLSAASDRFKVTINGKSAHAARPHQGIDSIVAAANWISAVQSVVSRSIHPAAPAVVTVGSIHGGAAANIIAESTELLGTVRSMTLDTRQCIMEKMELITRGTDSSFGTTSHLEWIPGVPGILNDPEIIRKAEPAISRVIGAKNMRTMDSVNLAAEDFAVYLTQIKGAFFRVGACEPGGRTIAAHSPDFFVPHDAIPVGAKVLASVALAFI